MKNIEELMAREFVKNRVTIGNAAIELGEDGFELHFDWAGQHVKMPLPSEKLNELHETLVAGELIRLGYLVFPVEGGWIVRSGEGEEYQLDDSTCTCGDFVWRREGKSRCKHLLFRDWFTRFRMKQMRAGMERDFGVS